MSKILRVVMVELHEAPYELNITDQLEDLQETVGGMIEVIGNGDGTLLVCNEESKLMGMDGNRRLNGDVIAGPFFCRWYRRRKLPLADRCGSGAIQTALCGGRGHFPGGSAGAYGLYLFAW